MIAPRAPESVVTVSTVARRVRQRASQAAGSGVNRMMTPKTPRETTDVAAGIGRLLRGLSRRAESGDLEAMTALRKLDQVLALETLRAAHALNVQHGYSWAEIGLAAGISKQGAFRRWGRA